MGNLAKILEILKEVTAILALLRDLGLKVDGSISLHDVLAALKR